MNGKRRSRTTITNILAGALREKQFFDKNIDGSGRSQTCEDDKEQKSLNQRNIDNMIMR